MLGLTGSSVWGEKETRSFVAKTYWKAAIWNNENDTGGENSVARVAVELGHVVIAALKVWVLIPGRNTG